MLINLIFLFTRESPLIGNQIGAFPITENSHLRWRSFSIIKTSSHCWNRFSGWTIAKGIESEVNTHLELCIVHIYYFSYSGSHSLAFGFKPRSKNPSRNNAWSVCVRLWVAATRRLCAWMGHVAFSGSLGISGWTQADWPYLATRHWRIVVRTAFICQFSAFTYLPLNLQYTQLLPTAPMIRIVRPILCRVIWWSTDRIATMIRRRTVTIMVPFTIWVPSTARRICPTPTRAFSNDVWGTRCGMTSVRIPARPNATFSSI